MSAPIPPSTVQCIVVSPRVSLLTLSTVRALRGCVTEKIKREVDSGKYLWVFDFSLSKNAPDSRSHALRFWVTDVADSAVAREMSVDEVIARILPPSRPSFHPDELCLRFSINRVTLFRMRKRWGCGCGSVSRQPLVVFLKSRWLGASNCPEGAFEKKPQPGSEEFSGRAETVKTNGIPGRLRIAEG